MPDEIRIRVTTLRGLFDTALDHIAKWNQLVPIIKQSAQMVELIDDSWSRAPTAVTGLTSEPLVDYLDKSVREASILATIPAPRLGLGPVLNTAGSAPMAVYTSFVADIGARFQHDQTAVTWANETLHLGQRLEAVRNRSQNVHRRLVLLHADLGDLHDHAVNAVLAAQAGTQSPIEAAANLDRLLEQFKGNLLARCKTGKGTTYGRISDNLAADSPLTRTVVSDGQITYDTLNGELMGIRKSMQPSTGERVVELLRQVEEHIQLITDALDPNKVGVDFTGR